ncbi:MAG TPA: ABC transporter permease [Terriglobales bacterium]|nr:ABC transporter permease [Terriglobales bacterium]
MTTVFQDLKYGLRMMGKSRGFTAVAVITLALGIGAATTIFSVIDNVLLNPFPYVDAHRIVMITIHNDAENRPGGRSWFRDAEFLDYQEQNHVFDAVIGGTGQDVLYFNGQGTEQFDGGLVTPNMFQVLGVPALLGRTLLPDDARPGAPPVFLMAYKLWATRFNLDPNIVGRTFVLNNVPTTLIGVMPPRVTKLGADLWIPVVPDRGRAEKDAHFYMFQAHLKPEVTLRQAQADVNVIAHRLAQIYPKNYPKQFSVQIDTWVDRLVGQFSKTLYTLAAAVGLLLLIACSNVANMLLAHGAAREKEMAIRASVGASQWRLVRQLLVESFILALGGALAGCLLAYAGIKILVTFIPQDTIPHEAVIGLNLTVLAFCIVVSIFTAVLAGLAPALQTAKIDIVERLKDSAATVSVGFRRGKLRSALVVVEVALSLVLLAGAGLLMRSFISLQAVDLGLRPDNILVARIPLPRGQYTTPAAKQQFFRTLLERVSALHGVVSATETSTLPPYGGIGTEIEISGKTHSDKWEGIFQLVSEGYFRTLGIRQLRGRTLSEVEVNDARKVAVINQTLARKYFGQEDPLGRSLTLKMLATEITPPVTDPVFEIVGIVSDAKNQGIQEPPRPEIFIPYTITGSFERGILVRTERDPLAMLDTLRKEIWSVDRNVALTMTGSLEDYLKRFSYAEPRFSLILLAVFAGIGLVLVTLGVYSLIAYTVLRQTREIGIRMSLGATRRQVHRMVLRMGLQLIALGAVAGLLLSFGLTRVLAHQLWSVSSHDPVTLAAVVGVMGLAGLAACYFPARRATQVDPIVALRYE